MAQQPRVIREKETFKTETFLNIDGEDVKFYCKTSVNYERLMFKVTPVITMIHGESTEADKAVLAAIRECRNYAKDLLSKYRKEAGIGTQGDLFEEAPASASN